MKTFATFAVVAALAAPAFAQESIDYRFDAVKRTVKVTKPKQPELRVAKGQHAQSGDKVQTGWFSYALIASDQHKAKFEIFSSTDVQLASGTPGVILSLERGRLRAVFDKITGNEPRVVETPGALLAVRGTQYDVEVDGSGRTTVDVWEGTVEVRSALLREPLLVHAGEESAFGRREPPSTRPIPGDRWRNAPPSRDGEGHMNPPDGRGPSHGGMPEGGPHRVPPGSTGPGGTMPGTMPGGMHGGHGSPQPGPQPTPMPMPPHKPPESL